MVAGDGRVRSGSGERTHPGSGSRTVRSPGIRVLARAAAAVLLFSSHQGAWSAATANGDGASVGLLAGRTQHTVTLLRDGSVLAVGGMRTESLSSARGDAERLVIDLEARRVVLSERLALAPRLFPQRAIHAAVPLEDGRVLIAGGNLSGMLELFVPDRDPSTAAGAEGKPSEESGAVGHFVLGPRLPGGLRAGIAAVALLDGRVLLVGGVNPNGARSARVELFDPSTDTVSVGPALGVARVSHTATLLQDGRVLIAGGIGLRSTEVFDPRHDTILPGPDLLHVHDDHAATRLLDGSVLITGGQDERGYSHGAVELLAPGAEEFSELESLHQVRADHAQVLLEDGSVWVLGGEQDSSQGDLVLDSVERFDPSDRRFSPVANLKVPRDDVRALVVGPDLILVIGGLGADGVGLNSIEWLVAPPR